MEGICGLILVLDIVAIERKMGFTTQSVEYVVVTVMGMTTPMSLFIYIDDAEASSCGGFQLCVKHVWIF